MVEGKQPEVPDAGPDGEGRFGHAHLQRVTGRSVSATVGIDIPRLASSLADKVRKEKLGDGIRALHQLVSPSGEISGRGLNSANVSLGVEHPRIDPDWSTRSTKRQGVAGSIHLPGTPVDLMGQSVSLAASGRQAASHDQGKGRSTSSLGKDFGSMSMDELLRSIWIAEESQLMASASASAAPSAAGAGEDGALREGARSVGGGEPQPGRQPTLREITLEDFLVRAGVVREVAAAGGAAADAGRWRRVTGAARKPAMAAGLARRRVDPNIDGSDPSWPIPNIHDDPMVLPLHIHGSGS